MFGNVRQDLLYAARSLRRDPLLAQAATLTLAICIGANTTVFSIANSILIRPLPYPGSERTDWISERSGPLTRKSAPRRTTTACANGTRSSKRSRIPADYVELDGRRE